METAVAVEAATAGLTNNNNISNVITQKWFEPAMQSYRWVYSTLPSGYILNRALGVVTMCLLELLPFRKYVSGYQMLSNITVLSRNISSPLPLKRNRSSFHLCLKNTSILNSCQKQTNKQKSKKQRKRLKWTKES